MKVTKRGGIAVVATLGAALVAAGCGGGGGSEAASAAKDSKVLDLVPKTAIGYITVDTDFNGDGWEQFDKLAAAFDDEYTGVGEEITTAAGEDDVDFEKDVDPWLGSTGGAALLSMKAGASSDDSAAGAESSSDSSGEFFVWVELEDEKAFETFAKDQGMEQGDKLGDFKTYTDPDDEDMHIAYNDEYIVLTDSAEQLKSVVEYDGDSITEVDGIGDAVDEVGSDALGTVVVSGDGVRALVKDNAELGESLGGVAQLKELNAMAMSLAAEDEGFRVSGFVGSDGDESVTNGSRDVFEGMPANTVFALGGQNLGGGLKTASEEAGKSNPQVQQMIGAGTAALGVSVDDLAKAFEGEFALGMGASDEGLGALAGTVMGAASGGGLGGMNPSQLAEAMSITLAFEETGTAKDTLGKLTQAAGGFLGAGAAPETGTSGDFETTTMNIQGLPLTAGSSDDVAAISLGTDVFSTWGEDALASNEAYEAAVSAADAPDEAAMFMFADAGRIANVAQLKGKDGASLGGMVGWLEGDGGNAKFAAFLQVNTED